MTKFKSKGHLSLEANGSSLSPPAQTLPAPAPVPVHLQNGRAEKLEQGGASKQAGPSPRASGQSKWWRSCWNGNQLDSELLYATIKAQQERRLAHQLALNGGSSGREACSEEPQVVAQGVLPVSQVTASGRPVSCVYSVPRNCVPKNCEPTSADVWRCREPSAPVQAPSNLANQQTGERCSPEKRPDEEEEENPLSDPLYASILGTSKKPIGGLKSRPGHATKSPAVSARRSLYQQQQPCKDEHCFKVHCRQVHPAQVDPAQAQLRSLVERCLEVQRATRKSGLLLQAASLAGDADGEETSEPRAAAEAEAEAESPEDEVQRGAEDEEDRDTRSRSREQGQELTSYLARRRGFQRAAGPEAVDGREPQRPQMKLLQLANGDATKDGGQRRQGNNEQTGGLQSAAALAAEPVDHQHGAGVEVNPNSSRENGSAISRDQNELEQAHREQQQLVTGNEEAATQANWSGGHQVKEKKSAVGVAAEAGDDKKQLERLNGGASAAELAGQRAEMSNSGDTWPLLSPAEAASSSGGGQQRELAKSLSAKGQQTSFHAGGSGESAPIRWTSFESSAGQCAEPTTSGGSECRSVGATPPRDPEGARPSGSEAAAADWSRRLSCRLELERQRQRESSAVQGTTAAAAATQVRDATAHQANTIEVPGQKQAGEGGEEEDEAMEEQQVSPQPPSFSEGNEIVIDSSSMRHFEKSPIRVRPVEPDEDSAGSTMAIEVRFKEQQQNLIQAINGGNMKKVEVAQSAPREANKQAEKEGKNSDRSSNENHTRLIEAAKRNDLANFFSHYKGASWRLKQLAQQIPQQDTRLLAGEPSEQAAETAQSGKQQENRLGSSEIEPSSSARQQSADEIKFIKNQRKLASQFKASLYYLSPVQAAKKTGAQANSKTANSWLRSSSSPALLTGSSASPANQRQEQPGQNCFKCKLAIEPGTACVQVDNLQLTGACQSSGERRLMKAQKISKNSSQRSKDGSPAEAGAIFGQEEKEASQCDGCHSTDSKSSCDEGLGTGSSGQSSAQSSSAGSHCDDRETPPHVACNVVDQQVGATGGQGLKRPIKGSISCDNLKLSTDSTLNSSNNNISKDHRAHQDAPTSKSPPHRSVTLAAGEPETQVDEQSKGKSRKGRALTWSASLSSFGASFRQLAQGAGKATQVQVAEGEQATGAQANSESILFHTDCFTCATCSEVLVDLRALIYVNEPQQQQQAQEEQQQLASGSSTASQAAARKLTGGSHSETSAEYVNLPGSNSNSDSDSEQTTCQRQESNQQQEKQQIGLYCHRHFVELFKPRCQQCDCLILDEECTEAEGKVWHIKHFCCTECRVPLGGQQYIIVDQWQTQASARLQAKGAAAGKDGGRPAQEGGQEQNLPYCLRCFDQVFGETCEECGKLITCDLGAINHEQRCWHASASCFKCRHCQKSLLGRPFLPSGDGRIYCSLRCSDSSSAGSRLPGAVQPGQKLDAPVAKGSGGQSAEQLSLASYSDPRAPHGALQHQLALAANTPERACAGELSSAAQMAAAYLLNRQQQEPQQSQAQRGEQGLLRHKALIDYLLAHARSDETSLQLLNYLYGQFSAAKRPVSELNHNDHCSRLMRQIGATLEQVERERGLHLGAKNINSGTHVAGDQQAANNDLSARRNKLNPFLIDPFGTGKGEEEARRLVSNIDKDCRVNYMNLDQAGLQCQVGNGNTATDGGSARGRHTLTSCKLTARFVAANLGDLNKAAQCSPAASLASNEGTISDHSASTSSGVSTAPPVSSTSGSLKSHSPLSSTSSHDSTGSSGCGKSSSDRATGEQVAGGGTGVSQVPAQQQQHEQQQQAAQQQRVSQAALERRRRVQPITELSVLDLLTAADDQLEQQQQQQPSDAFDQLVSHFESGKRQQQQQQQQHRPLGLQRAPTGGEPGQGARIQQQESFFFELAQRLPQRVGAQLRQHLGPVQPLDTNGLPTVADACLAPADCGPRAPITDHYSTVNKAPKLAPTKSSDERQHSNERAAAESFFALTSPLLACRTGDLSSGPQERVRPTSSLSVLTGEQVANNNGQAASGGGSLLHASYSANSLGRQGGAGVAQSLAGELAHNKRPLTKPAKSVSFDPALEDPDSSSPSPATAGQAGRALKSALKWPQQQQQQQQQPHHHLHQMPPEFWLQQQHLMAAGSAATMPAGLASQIRANSLAAYSAHYDEQGRRVRLSSLVNGLQVPLSQLPATGAPPSDEQLNKSRSSSSLLSGALSKLSLGGSQSSRGGRREMRAQQQQQQQQAIQTQPMPSAGGALFVQPLEPGAHLFHQPSMQAADGQVQRHRGRAAERPARSSGHHARRHHGRHHSRRAPSPRRRSSSRRASGGRSSRWRRSSSSRRSSARYCDQSDCYSDDEDDACSTCSSTCTSESYNSEDEDASESASSAESTTDELDARRSRRGGRSLSRRHYHNHRGDSDASETSYDSTCTYSTSSGSEEEEDGALSGSDDDSCSSSSACSRSSSSCSAHSSSANQTTSEARFSDSEACQPSGSGGPAHSRRRRRRSSGSSRGRSSSGGGGGNRPRRRSHRTTRSSTDGASSRRHRNSARRLSRSSSRSSSSRSTCRRSSAGGATYRCSEPPHKSSSSSSSSRRQGRRGGSRGQQAPAHEPRAHSSSRHLHGGAAATSRSSAHQAPIGQHQQVAPQPMSGTAQQLTPANQLNYYLSPQAAIHRHPTMEASAPGVVRSHLAPMQGGSPSTASTESKAVSGNENCRII